MAATSPRRLIRIALITAGTALAVVALAVGITYRSKAICRCDGRSVCIERRAWNIFEGSCAEACAAQETSLAGMDAPIAPATTPARMGTLVSIYVRVDKPNLPRLQKLLKPEQQLVFEEGKGFAEVPSEQPFDAEFLSGISDQLGTDVIWLAFQSAVDAFEYRHWRNGELLRVLVNGCFEEERTWERVMGAPEAWESWEKEPRPGEFDALNAREVARRVARHYGLPGWE